MPRKFDQDAKDRVVRLVEDRILAENMPMQAACQAVAPKLGVSWNTARPWFLVVVETPDMGWVIVWSRNGIRVLG